MVASLMMHSPSPSDDSGGLSPDHHFDSRSLSNTDGTDSPEGLKALLQRLLRIKVQDGRIFLGTFAGTDQPLNLLLINADEFRDDDESGIYTSRYVGQILIPWRLVVTIEAQRPPTMNIM